jgi:diacylglycerol kinase family enzyme
VSPPTGRIGVLALPMRALVGGLERHEQFETFGATTVRIAFRHQRLGVAIDGEVTQMPSPLEFSVRRQALRLLGP